MEFIVSENCLLCSRKFDWNEVIIMKAPEGACFCMKCIETFEDTNEYKGDDAWIVTEYRGKEKYVKDN